MCRNICMFGKNNQILSRILNYSDLDGHSMCTITPKPTKSKFLGFEQSNWVNSSFKPESELFAPFLELPYYLNNTNRYQIYTTMKKVSCQNRSNL